MSVRTLKDRAVFWLEQIKAYNQHQFNLNPQHSALLIIDMQNYFVDNKENWPFAESQEIVPNIQKLQNRFRDRQLPVIFTAHAHKSPQLDGGNLTWWWSDYCREGSQAAEIYAALQPLEDEKIIRKRRYSAFEGTDLGITLRCLEVTDLVITGVLTNLCCETTAREAFNKDYRIQFVCDATATINEELHLATLKNIAYGFAPVVTTDEILTQLK